MTARSDRPDSRSTICLLQTATRTASHLSKPISPRPRLLTQSKRTRRSQSANSSVRPMRWSRQKFRFATKDARSHTHNFRCLKKQSPSFAPSSYHRVTFSTSTRTHTNTHKHTYHQKCQFLKHRSTYTQSPRHSRPAAVVVVAVIASGSHPVLFVHHHSIPNIVGCPPPCSYKNASSCCCPLLYLLLLL